MKRAVCTGVSGSIGFAIANRFLRAFPDVELIGTYRTDPREARDLRAFPQLSLMQVDLSMPASWRFPPDVTYLINNAALPSGKHLIADIPRSEVDSLMSVNLLAPFLLIQHVLPHMLAERRGRIVNVNSIWGLRGSSRNGAYVATKHGLSGLTKAVAKDYAKFGITCNEVCPGAVQSRVMDSVIVRLADEQCVTPDEVKAGFEAATNSGRLATPDEVAAAVVFLCETSSAHVNGTSVVVDGGVAC